MKMFHAVTLNSETPISRGQCARGGSSRWPPIRATAKMPAAPAATHRPLKAHTGISASTPAETLKLLWTYDAGEIVESSAAIVDDVVYVGSGDGDLLALNLASGTLRWKYVTGNLIGSQETAIHLQACRGVVVSDAMDKTVVVRVDILKPHPKYHKMMRRSIKLPRMISGCIFHQKPIELPERKLPAHVSVAEATLEIEEGMQLGGDRDQQGRGQPEQQHPQRHLDDRRARRPARRASRYSSSSAAPPPPHEDGNGNALW
jgi:hypothetical protein